MRNLNTEKLAGDYERSYAEVIAEQTRGAGKPLIQNGDFVEPRPSI